jgi:hypothetical protein
MKDIRYWGIKPKLQPAKGAFAYQKRLENQRKNAAFRKLVGASVVRVCFDSAFPEDRALAKLTANRLAGEYERTLRFEIEVVEGASL